jgi:hypothetical protein
VHAEVNISAARRAGRSACIYHEEPQWLSARLLAVARRLEGIVVEILAFVVCALRGAAGAGWSLR